MLSGGEQFELIPFIQVYPHIVFPHRVPWAVPVMHNVEGMNVFEILTHIVYDDEKPYLSCTG